MPTRCRECRKASPLGASPKPHRGDARLPSMRLFNRVYSSCWRASSTTMSAFARMPSAWITTAQKRHDVIHSDTPDLKATLLSGMRHLYVTIETGDR